ncbi:MAG: AGE family epimerase/isomerase [Pseudomonadota bacterium]
MVEIAHKVHPVILCGGAGTRLWPLSTELRPKQLLPLTERDSMIAATAARVEDPDLFHPAKAIGSLRYHSELRTELPDAKLILEPFGRDSAPAVLAAALTAEPDDIVLILPADHSIRDTESFHTAIRHAVRAANQDYLVTFGIVPDHPATGYGYIKTAIPKDGFFEVEAFEEKPQLERAEAFLKGGQHYWNAGIFLFKAGVMLEAFRLHADDILESTRKALNGYASDTVHLSRDHFAKVRKDSIDYAVMEHADNVAMVPVEMGWSDIGDFSALAGHKSPNRDTVSEGPVVFDDCEGSFFHSDGPTLAVKGLHNTAVIANQNQILVTPLDQATQIKDVVNKAKSDVAKGQVSEENRTRFKTWLLDKVLPFWFENGAFDDGGFVEAVDFYGKPLASLERRGRIAPRQVFVWSEALRIGFDPEGGVSDMVKAGIEYLTETVRTEAGGWPNKLDKDGIPQPGPHSFYDHAFVALAASAAHRATRSPEAAQLASDAFEFIDTRFYDKNWGGWNHNDGHTPMKLVDPHMHYLEACLVDYETSYSEAAKSRIIEVCELFEQRMFDVRSGAVFEAFAADWSLPGPAGEQKIEPGHCFEWAFLLSEAERLTGRDLGSWRRRLITFAETHGLDDSGKVYDWVTLDGRAHAQTFRLWPQLERFRAHYSHPTPKTKAVLASAIDQIWETYIEGYPDGLWMDKVDDKGAPAIETVPTSVVYHLITALAPLF